MRKKIFRTLTVISLVAALGLGCASAKNNETDGIKVIYDGQTISFDVEPEIIDGRTMVPMRAIFEAFGAKVKWDGDTQTITAKKKSKTIEMTIGSSDMTKNDESYSFDAAPTITDGRTLVPIRAISDMLGLDVSWDEDTKTVTITTPEDDEDDAWKENTGTIDLDDVTVTGNGISVSDNVITISEGGDFEVTGTIEDGQIVIDTEDKVKLRLSGMSLTNKSGSAIYIKNADKAYITLTDGTENTLTDAESYTSGDEDEKACITSRDNLEIKGDGSLTVNGNYNHGIDSSDSLEISNGNITINAKNDGIHVNDTLEISGGTLNVTAEGDGLQADEIVDITDGSVNVTTTGEVASDTSEFNGAPQDMGGGFHGMRGENETTDTSSSDTQSEESSDVSSKGIKAGWMLDISGGDITVNSTDHAIHCTSDINIKGGEITLASESKKGISAHGNIVIDDGDIDITKATEGIETKQIITINGGDINIVSSDDGINAGGNSFGEGGGMGGEAPADMPNNTSENTSSDAPSDTPSQNGDMQRGGGGGRGMGGGRGNMTPPQMPSGDMQNGDGMTPPQMPSGDMQNGDMQNNDGMTPPQMPDGDMPSDDAQNNDGMNAPQMPDGNMGGGMQSDGMSGSQEVSTEHHIQINGGNIYIDAKNDGLDSNGTMIIDGGNIVIDGPTDGAESAFDTDNGLFEINGGTVLGIGSTGLGETPSSSSEQKILYIVLDTAGQAGQELEIKDSDGDTVFEHTGVREYASILCSSDELKEGETYTLYIDGSEIQTITVGEDAVATVGSSQKGGGGKNSQKGGEGDRGNDRRKDDNTSSDESQQSL